MTPFVDETEGKVGGKLEFPPQMVTLINLNGVIQCRRVFLVSGWSIVVDRCNVNKNDGFEAEG
jgi:hypothetical protein